MEDTIKLIDAAEVLSELLEPYSDLRPHSRRKRYEMLGEELAELVDRPRGPFTASYLENVLAGWQPVGEPLRRAIVAYLVSRENGCPIVGAFSPVTVRSRDNVEPASLILGRSIRCGYCKAPIVPKVPNQVYCSKVCKSRARSRRRREK